MTTLREAIRLADLPAMLERLHPTCGARAGKRGRVRCVWRGGEELSASVYQVPDGGWRLHDFVTDQTWDAFSALVEIGGLTRSQAARELIGTRVRPRRRPKQRPTVSACPDFPDELHAMILWARITKRPLWPVDEPRTEQGRRALELLAGWMAEELRPALEPRK